MSSISGSDSDSDLDSDASRTTSSADFKSRKPVGIPSHLTSSGNTSTDSESEGGQVEDAAQRLPKVYFRTAEGELVSIYRCVLCHKRVWDNFIIVLLAKLRRLGTFGRFFASFT